MSVWCKVPLMVAWVLGFGLSAATAQPAGSMGWRGDGTGKFPAADPPTQWGRVSTAVEDLRFHAGPGGRAPDFSAGSAGTPMPDGVIHQWLVLGPVPSRGTTSFEQDTLPGEAELAEEAADRRPDLA